MANVLVRKWCLDDSFFCGKRCIVTILRYVKAFLVQFWAFLRKCAFCFLQNFRPLKIVLKCTFLPFWHRFTRTVFRRLFCPQNVPCFYPFLRSFFCLIFSHNSVAILCPAICRILQSALLTFCLLGFYCNLRFFVLQLVHSKKEFLICLTFYLFPKTPSTQS